MKSQNDLRCHRNRQVTLVGIFSADMVYLLWENHSHTFLDDLEGINVTINYSMYEKQELYSCIPLNVRLSISQLTEGILYQTLIFLNV